MSITSLHSGASALSALNTALDVTANNLANVNTAGFKASRANFQDLLYIEKTQPGIENATGQRTPTGLYVGLGVKVAGTQLDFAEGSPVRTDRPLDVLIEGHGFFRVNVQDSLGTGGVAYTRSGQFAVNNEGRLVLATDTGRALVDDITIPPNASNIKIDQNGQVSVSIDGEAEPQVLDTIQTAVFVNPAGLSQVGENLFVETAASGPPIVGDPGTENFGQLQQGVYESSNVDPTRELIELIRTQRAFEMNSQTIRAADEALRTVANLRR
ncbi:MAG: flagellar basal-body rod protein FlgG [Phycisphaerales bacterium]